ncbi:MAG TPA: gephyrin-like molybdotransferase Glp [Dokdonella sp.]|uniref:molybdopterin molybdotransferase MoeA n=1 Tax=Dokdonella sp. TaxID=2291710 RepID=UPI002D80CCE9|nr:gephyrin-like molybdotransferase Glp [Dokdonella sp.]HET9031615.1 gephyrin-like molybdotransferase Glp [Dokdonella sp.]
MNEFPTRLSVAQAQACIAEQCALRRLPAVTVALQDAFARVLASNVLALRNQPPFANSAMDGFAVRGEDLAKPGPHRLRLIGTRLAGDGSTAQISPGECLRITTGAPLPVGADTVVIKEHCVVDAEFVVIGAGETRGSHVRPPGEDFRTGDIVVGAGRRIHAAELAALASTGFDEVSVSALPRVRVMTTGDELVMPGAECGAAQIYNSNGFGLAAMLRSCGIGLDLLSADGREPAFTHLPDDRERIRSALLDAANSADLIITSGGVSAGEADFLPGLIAEIGRVHFWKVRMRPGMPILFAEIGRTLVFCLPGNPVSTMATFLCLVRPGLEAMQGAGIVGPRLLHARLATPISKRHDRTEFMRAVSEVRDDGTLWATPIARQGSSMIRGLVEANALIVVPEQSRTLDVSSIVQILPLTE